MRIERTEDSQKIKEIVTHPSVWEKVSDDGADKETYLPFISPSVYWLSIVKEDKVIGVYFLHPHNAICYEIHTCILPEAWGKDSREASRLVLKWIFENTKCEKVITNVPENNPIALRYAEKAGLKVYGINTKSYKKDGKLLNQTVLGIEKGEWTCL